MYPHERSLVKRLSDEPFALLGINSDADRGALKKTLRRENINWRSWWDGGSTRGPIAKTWNIETWPAIYVLDHQGVIRYKNIKGTELHQAVEKLVTEAEK